MLNSSKHTNIFYKIKIFNFILNKTNFKLKKSDIVIKNGPPTSLVVETDFTVTALESSNCKRKHIIRRGGVSSSSDGDDYIPY